MAKSHSRKSKIAYSLVCIIGNILICIGLLSTGFFIGRLTTPEKIKYVKIPDTNIVKEAQYDPKLL